MTMTLPVISNLLHCKGISTREQLYFRGRGGFVEFGKFQGLTLCFHDQTMRRSNFEKINQNVLSLSTRSMQMELKRNAIVFGKRSSVEVVDGWEENKELLEDHLNSLRHAITMDNPEAAIGVMDKLGSLPLNDELKESARDINELEDQLHELFIQVQQIIETGDEGTARELIDANYESVAEQLEIGIKGVEQAAMLDILAQLHMSLSDFKATKNLLEQIKKILAGVGNHEPLVDKILEHMGTMYTALEEPKEALPLYTRSLGIQEAVLGKNNPLLVNLLLSLANTYNAVDEGHKSIQLYHRAITILERRKGSESEDLVFPLTHLSHVLIEEGEFDEAENSLHRALGIMEKLHGENDGRVGAVTCVLARALCANGKVDDAVVLYEKGLQIMERNGNLSLDDPVLETTRTDLAELLHVLGSLVVPRDSFTVATLKKALPVSARAKIKYLGNPMMDNLKPSGALDFLKKCIPALFVALLPGSRAPEVYLNWQTILDAVDNLLRTPISNQMIFLVPIVPFLEIDSFSKTLLDMGWKFTAPERIMHDADDLVFSLKDIIATDTSCDEKNDILHSFSYKKDNALVLLIRGLFPDVASWADAGIAMAGTATEQLVGLGKPVFTIAGNGPQFTNDFANAQSRLLGNSIIPCSSNSVAKNMSNILGDNMYMNVVRRNGRKRMGTAGASRNIAEEIHHIIYE